MGGGMLGWRRDVQFPPWLENLGEEPCTDARHESDDQKPDDGHTIFIDEAHGSLV